MAIKTNNLSMWKNFQATVINCRKCPRLVVHRETVPARPLYQHQKYWRRPLPGFGDQQAWLLITGLAPAGDGGNRTGRVFTGDATARFLVKALYAQGWANQPISESLDDGLILKDCYLTAAVKCFPPKHKPTRQECVNCHPYYMQEIEMLFKLRVILVLGKLAFDAFLLALKKKGLSTKGIKFKHGAFYSLENGLKLYCSYHPTPRNVNTGTLTEKMFYDLLEEIKKAQ
jgi:uracil-DNA glycosylase family 4